MNRSTQWITRMMPSPSFLKRWRVYRTFVLGLLIGLGYAAITSEKGELWNSPVLAIFDQRVLVLTVSGILGGIIYTIMVDGNVELPHFHDDTGDQFEAGLLGDMLLGIVGALVLEFLTSPIGVSETTMETVRGQTPFAIYGAKGILGGYGSKTLIDIALKRFINRADTIAQRLQQADQKNQELVEQRSQLQHENDILQDHQELLEQLNDYLEHGLPEEQAQVLFEQMADASLDLRAQIFLFAKQLRRTTSRTDEFRDTTQRTIPIFSILIDAGQDEQGSLDPDYYAYHAQLAFAYKDAVYPPTSEALTQALSHLNQAIALRPPEAHAATWKYELNRAMVQIEQERLETGQFVLAQPQSDIVNDLLAVAQTQELTAVLQAAQAHHIPTPILEWLTHYQAALAQDLTQYPQIQALLAPLSPSSEMPSESPVSSSAPPPESPTRSSPSSPPPEQADPRELTTEPRLDSAPAVRRSMPAGPYAPAPMRKPIPEILASRAADRLPSPSLPAPLPPPSDEALLAQTSYYRWHKALLQSQPRGAAAKTARNGLNPSHRQLKGRKASRQMARDDWSRVKGLWARFERAGETYALPPSVLAAIASRESRCGRLLTRGWGDRGQAFGIMQIDKNYHAIKGVEAGPDSLDHIHQAAEILAQTLKQIIDKHPDWKGKYLLQGAIAAYNVGVKNIRTVSGIDRGTTHDDYGADVMARAQFFAERRQRQRGAGLLAASVASRMTSHDLRPHALEPNDLDPNGLEPNDWETNDHQELESIPVGPPPAPIVANTTAQPVGAALTKDMPFDTLITPHIRYGELTKYSEARRFTHDYQCATAYELCVFLEKCRTQFGDRPLIITSGHRPPAVNAAQGGASQSEHLYDSPDKGAVDFLIQGVSVYEVQTWCDHHYPYSVGYGARRGFVHLGMRPGRPKVRWDY